jgi:glutaredoxin-like protein NrdH
MTTLSTFRDGIDGPAVQLTPPPEDEAPEIPEVVVFTLPSCVQCVATKRHLTALGVEFESVDLTAEPEILEALKARGYASAPIVVSPRGIWSGYSPDAVKALG